MSKTNWHHSIFIAINPLIAIAILIAFICYYSIPPLVDFSPHVVMGMMADQPLKYYHYQSALTYRLLDSIIRFWTLIFGAAFLEIALASYLTVIFLIISMCYSFCLLLGMSFLRALCTIGIILGPVFLFLHTTHFIWGLIAYTLAVFSATISAVSLWCLESELILAGRVKLQTTIIFLAYTLLAIFSHIGGFLYLAIAWSIPLLRLIKIKKARLKLLTLLAVLTVLIIPLFLLAWHQVISGFVDDIFAPLIAMKNLYFLKILLYSRAYWWLSGGPYSMNGLVPASELGLFGIQQVTQLLTFAPFIVAFTLIISFLNKRPQKNILLTLIILELILAITIDLFLPFNWWNLLGIYSRHWLFICAWMFIGIIYLLSNVSNRTFHILCYLSPLLVLIACYILTPLYSNFRRIPIESVASTYSNQLLNAVSDYRQNHPESASKDIIVSYFPTMVNTGRPQWRQYSVVPFIMMLSPQLSRNKIYIKEHWLTPIYPHLPIFWKEPEKSNAIHLVWDRSVNQTDIILSKRSPAG